MSSTSIFSNFTISMNKLAKGSPQYQSLWRAADSKVDQFCLQYNASRIEIEAQAPALKELEDLAQAPAVPNRKAQLAVGSVTGLALIVAVGFTLEVLHWLFTLGWLMAHHILNHLR